MIIPKSLIKADLIRCISEEREKVRTLREVMIYAKDDHAHAKLTEMLEEGSRNVVILTQKLARMFDQES